ncbi:MAG: tetratricopeptide repeat protein [Bryobacteraceae bacterium]|nr:tetratricopeptide repeat protein [Bryobacteraceae bacterium]
MRFPSSVLRGFSAAITLLVFAQVTVAQDQAPAQPSPSTSPSTGTPGGTPGGRPDSFPTPGQRNPQQQPFPDPNQQQRFPDMQRPIFLSGKVVLEDGTAPMEQVVIERVCNGQPRPEGYTDSKGRFSFQLGQNQHMMADASVGSDNGFGGMNAPGQRSNSSMGGFGGMSGGRQISERDLIGCEIRAVLPGYRSEVVPLSGRRTMDNPDLGTIILKRLGNVEGLTISATTAAAPKDARKAFDKGRDKARQRKWADAQKEYEKAVALYPKYANAWSDLGMVYEAQNNTEGARKAYTEALAADAKLVKPYVQMAYLWAKENKWQECADASDRALKLNPFDYPQAYFVNAVANLNLKKLDAAEKSAREGMKLDPSGRMPKIKHVLGIVLAQKQDFNGAMEHMKGYLAAIPQDGQEAAMVKKQLAEVEKFAGTQASQAPAAAQQ